MRRIVFYDPALFLKAIDKVSFEDFLLSDDFSLEDGFKIYTMMLRFHLGFGLMWMKDVVIEALSMAKSGLSDNATNVGNLSMYHSKPRYDHIFTRTTDSRIKILGRWVYNVPHSGKISDKTWHVSRLTHITIELIATLTNSIIVIDVDPYG